MEVLMHHYQAARFSKEVSRLASAPRSPSKETECTTTGGFALLNWTTEQGIDPLGPAVQIDAFMFYLFDTHCLSPQTIKGYRPYNAAAVQAKTISGMITSMELQRPRIKLVLLQWDLRHCTRRLEQASL